LSKSVQRVINTFSKIARLFFIWKWKLILQLFSFVQKSFFKVSVLSQKLINIRRSNLCNLWKFEIKCILLFLWHKTKISNMLLLCFARPHFVRLLFLSSFIVIRYSFFLIFALLRDRKLRFVKRTPVKRTGQYFFEYFMA